MKLHLTISIFLVFITGVTLAQKGGYIRYDYLSSEIFPNTTTYNIIAYIYYSKSPPFSPIKPPLDLLFFDAGNGAPVNNLSGNEPGGYTLTIITNQFSPCVNTAAWNNKFFIVYYNKVLTVPNNADGYLITSSFRGRDSGQVNINLPAAPGFLMSAAIPGGINRNNTSLEFVFRDTVSVCRNHAFSFPISAIDADNDSISYAFGDAIQAAWDSASSPPYIPVQYNPPYSGADPTGTGLTINPATGVISGVAPDVPGLYNITVNAKEWRAGEVISTTKKETAIKVVNCPFAPPLLKPVYSHCGVRTFNFKTEPTCPVITSFQWDFGNPNSTSDTSSRATPSYTYPGTGTYILKLKVANNDGYIDSATAMVKVVDSIPIFLRSDTAICKKDTIVLRPVSDGVNYTWIESGGGNTLSSYNIKMPKATPVAGSTRYAVTTTLDACVASASITVNASPYPKSNAGKDTAICLGLSTMLDGSYTGAYYTWTPTNSLTNSSSLQPIATPQITTAYLLSVRDTFYCPKTVTDTVVVRVVQAFTINAGNDTSVVIGQPLQLKAVSKGNTTMLQHNWQPASYFNNNRLYNPIATITAGAPDEILFTVSGTTVEGCSATDNLVVKVFKIAPGILVPSAFSPNGDGKNDVLKPVLVGMKSLERFTIYNRWGQVIFSTTENNKGWDGIVKGTPQRSDVYVYTAEGITYPGKKIFKKGTVFLIR